MLKGNDELITVLGTLHCYLPSARDLANDREPVIALSSHPDAVIVHVEALPALPKAVEAVAAPIDETYGLPGGLVHEPPEPEVVPHPGVEAGPEPRVACVDLVEGGLLLPNGLEEGQLATDGAAVLLGFGLAASLVEHLVGGWLTEMENCYGVDRFSLWVN